MSEGTAFVIIIIALITTLCLAILYPIQTFLFCLFILLLGGISTIYGDKE